MATFYLDYVNGSDSNNGSSWALAWKTFTSGATAARIASGDIIRVAKSPTPSSIGNTTWTDRSKTVTLASALTQNIDLCEVIWTGTGDTTVTLVAVGTDGKQGDYSVRLTVDSSPQANILQAYHATGTLDLSSKQKISFWIKNTSAIVAGNWVVKLCSDTAGATPVDEFPIPAIPSTGYWVPLTLTRTGEGNLNSSIGSIAIYTGGVTTGLASSVITVDDFIACTSDGLNLQSLISKNSLEQGGSEGWFGIQSIDNTDIKLDNEVNTKGITTVSGGRGYSGASETVASYKRETIKTAMASATSTVVNNVMDSGSSGNQIQFQGGYNTASNEQDGETFFDGLNGNGYGIQISSKSYVTLNRLQVVRYYYGINLTSATWCNFSFQNLSNNFTGLYGSSSHNNTFSLFANVNQSAYGIRLVACIRNTFTEITNANSNFNAGLWIEGNSFNNYVILASNLNNNVYGLYLYAGPANNLFDEITKADYNTTAGIAFEFAYYNLVKKCSSTFSAGSGILNNPGINFVRNAVLTGTTEVSGGMVYSDCCLFSWNHDGNVGDFRIYYDGGQILAQTAVRHTPSGKAWKLEVTSSTRTSSYPLRVKIAEVPVNANSQVTVKAWFYKDSASGIAGKLVCRGKQLTGIPNDVTATTSEILQTWEELTIQFTPTEAGILEIEAWAYYVSALSNVYVHDLTISQV